MKRIISIPLILIIMLSLFAGCSGNKGKDISLYDLGQAMTNASDNLGELSYASSEDANPDTLFANISDMDYSKVKGFFIYYAKEGKGNADEIALINVKNSSDLSDARQSLQNHLDKRIALYKTYDKTQVEKLNEAKIATSSNCAVLIVADDADRIEKAFYDYFSDEVSKLGVQ